MAGTVVVTGSGGRIGTLLRPALAGAYHLRGIDRVPTPGLPEATVAALTDLDAILPTFAGADAVVHLAADPRHTPDIWWDTLIPDNVVATANVFEAARRGGVRRVVFFSSMHVCGMYESDPPWSRIAAGDYAGLDPATVPLVTALGVGLASSIRGRSPLRDGFGLIAFASLTPMAFVLVFGMVVFH